MEYLYGEMQPPQRKSLETHVKACRVCDDQKREFTGAMQSLDGWNVELPAKHSLASGGSRVQPVLKWAAAAALLVSTAFATGRFSRPEVDLAALQARIEAPLRERIEQQIDAASEKAAAEVRARVEVDMAARMHEISLRAQADAELAAQQQMEQLAASLASLREEDRVRMSAVTKMLETQWVSEFRKMREDLERVALFTDQSYRDAQRQLVQLASVTQSTAEPVTKEN